jgi:hypothetical protein
LEAGIPFSPGLDLLLYPQTVDQLAALALVHRKFHLGFEIGMKSRAGLEHICTLLLDFLGSQSLSDYFKCVQQKLDPSRGADLCTELMKAVCKRARSSSDVPRFIAAVIETVPLQIHILTECGFLQEALALAKRSRTTSEIKSILRTAEILGNQAIARQCQKLLHV